MNKIYALGALIGAVDPSPGNFDAFVPWACSEYSANFIPLITRQYIKDEPGTTSSLVSKGKSKKKISAVHSDSLLYLCGSLGNLSLTTKNKIVNIQAVYDSTNRLIQIKIWKNTIKIPELLLKVIGLCLPYHKSLNNISIDSVISQSVILEISKLLSASNITEVILDKAVVEQGNYYLLLDNLNVLKHLSLSKCRISDELIKTIASRLVYPNTGSKMLSALNLASNNITDIGASYLANALRSNRKLSYLNLSDNRIQDSGAASILAVLKIFPITSEEIYEHKKRYSIYLKKKIEVASTILERLRIDAEKKGKKKAKCPPLIVKRPTNASYSTVFKDPVLSEKANIEATKVLGNFEDPFFSYNTILVNDKTNCLGNNVLCYLNLAYNELTYNSLKNIIDVLVYQRQANRKPKGLVKIVLEGNLLPGYCKEYEVINEMFKVSTSMPTKGDRTLKK